MKFMNWCPYCLIKTKQKTENSDKRIEHLRCLECNKITMYRDIKNRVAHRISENKEIIRHVDNYRKMLNANSGRI